jgi:hypothetical protein
MAYHKQRNPGDSSVPLVIGAGVLGYLWYKGYLGAWFPSIFGSNTVAPSTSVTSGATTPTVQQIHGPTNEFGQSVRNPLVTGSAYTDAGSHFHNPRSIQ